VVPPCPAEVRGLTIRRAAGFSTRAACAPHRVKHLIGGSPTATASRPFHPCPFSGRARLLPSRNQFPPQIIAAKERKEHKEKTFHLCVLCALTCSTAGRKMGAERLTHFSAPIFLPTAADRGKISCRPLTAEGGCVWRSGVSGERRSSCSGAGGKKVCGALQSRRYAALPSALNTQPSTLNSFAMSCSVAPAGAWPLADGCPVVETVACCLSPCHVHCVAASLRWQKCRAGRESLRRSPIAPPTSGWKCTGLDSGNEKGTAWRAVPL